MSLSERWAQELATLRSVGQFRTLRPACGIDLCSNDYLGYATRPPLAGSESSCELSAGGRSGTSSRLLRGQIETWDAVEQALAAWHRSESTLVFSSGYAANEGLLSTVIGRDDWVASDQLNHASIIDGLRLSRAERFIYRHLDLDQLEDGLRSAASSRRAGRELFVVTESLFGMDGDLAPLESVVELVERYGAQVIVDEAHATGCFGENGGGLVDQHRLRERVLATMHTGGKALAVVGAYVCGSALLRELLINRCRHFMFSTALPPMVASWWLETIRRVQADQSARAALDDAAAYFRNQLSGWDSVRGSTYIVPVVVGDDRRCARVATALAERGWDIRAVRPPTVPAHTARLRISIHANHDHELLSRVARDLSDILEETT